jgi:hypothetical protein
MEMFAKSMRRFNLHTPVTNVQAQIYDIEEGENMQHEHNNRTQPSKKTPKQSISYDFVAVSLARINF